MVIPPETLRLLDESIRRDFQSARDIFFSGLLVMSALVAAGVILEEIFELIPFETDRLELSTGLRVSRRTRVLIIKLLTKLGWALVVVGVAGEGVFEGLVSKADGQLQTFNESVLSSASHRASNAELIAIAFDARIAEARRGTIEAQRDAAQANALARKYESGIHGSDARAKRAEAQVASANARAEEAHSMAESERTARMDIQRQLAWRELTQAQRDQIGRALLPFAGQQFNLVTYATEGECLNLTNELYSALLSGRWVLDPNRRFAVLFSLVVGVEVLVSEKATDSN
jgi:hypothetical protein